MLNILYRDKLPNLQDVCLIESYEPLLHFGHQRWVDLCSIIRTRMKSGVRKKFLYLARHWAGPSAQFPRLSVTEQFLFGPCILIIGNGLLWAAMSFSVKGWNSRLVVYSEVPIRYQDNTWLWKSNQVCWSSTKPTSLSCNLVSPWYRWIAHLVLNNNHSLKIYPLSDQDKMVNVCRRPHINQLYQLKN
jgi:hypothetical protein